MNSKDSSLLRIERALDRVERTLKMIDTRVSQLHAAANFSKNKNNSIQKCTPRKITHTNSHLENPHRK